MFTCVKRKHCTDIVNLNKNTHREKKTIILKTPNIYLNQIFFNNLFQTLFTN